MFKYMGKFSVCMFNRTKDIDITSKIIFIKVKGINDTIFHINDI